MARDLAGRPRDDESWLSEEVAQQVKRDPCLATAIDFLSFVPWTRGFSLVGLAPTEPVKDQEILGGCLPCVEEQANRPIASSRSLARLKCRSEREKRVGHELHLALHVAHCLL